tara:strand:- start:144 stop:1637 length:1494 start_codon:yes stop_codon:yes gene_type:complete
MRIIKNLILNLSLIFTLMSNAQDPNAPVITFLSVDHSTQQVEINWVNSTPNVVSYVIYFEDITGLWIPLDTVMGIANTTYLTSTASPQQKKETFSIVAIDAMGNSSVRSDPHSTVFLKFDYQNCDTSLALFWNSYLNMFAMDGYQLKAIREDIQSGTVFLEQTIAISSDNTSLVFPIEYSSKYTLWLETMSPVGNLSKSNFLEIFTTDIDKPQYCYINKVSVIGENSIEVSVLSDSRDIDYINVYKSNLENGFQFYSGQASATNNEYLYIDPLVLPERNFYYYQAKPVDICGKEYDLPKYISSNDVSYAHNLKLSLLSASNEFIYVETSEYDNFLSNSHLELWKEVNGERSFLKDVYPLTDYDVSISSDVGKICLFLVSTENLFNVLDRKDTVYSNMVCVSKSPSLYIPNAFTPSNQDVKNNKWQVIINDKKSIQNFNLKIFDKYGRAIFETSSIDEGWDGTLNNNLAPCGIYIYKINIDYAQGEQLTDTGSITLLR